MQHESPVARASELVLGVALCRVVRAERLKRDWSQAKLAKRTGITRGTIARIECLHRSITLVHVVLFAQAFEIATSELVRRAETFAANP